MSKTVIFFGTDSFSAPALRALIDGQKYGYTVGAVVTKPDSKQGRGQKLTAPLVKEIAIEHGIPVLQPTKLIEITNDIKKFESPIGVLSSYGKIVPQSVIDLFTPGIINIHPSLLPNYRGPSPIETTILNGDEFAGVSIMLLTKEMDAGPLYESVKFGPMDGDETAPDLYNILSEKGANILITHLRKILDGTGDEPYEQSKTGIEPTYTALLKKEDGKIDPSAITADQAERQVRAFLMYPKSRLTINNIEVIVTKAHVSKEESDLAVRFHDGNYLVIDELIAPSGRSMSGKAFLNGYAAGA